MFAFTGPLADATIRATPKAAAVPWKGCEPMGLECLIRGKRFVASYSGGKDSTLSIWRAIQAGGQLGGLVTTVNKERDGSYSHCI
ncbi:MAG: hypothetical protein ACM3ZQ_00655, partial [Bacillota bacterium]